MIKLAVPNSQRQHTNPESDTHHHYASPDSSRYILTYEYMENFIIFPPKENNELGTQQALFMPFLFFFPSASDGTQGLEHNGQVFYN